MLHLRKWQLPNGVTVHRYDEIPNAWSYFWYCSRCGEVYARAPAYTDSNETTHPLPFVAIGGCCLNCNSNKFSISGTLETVRFIGWPVPIEVVQYQLEREIAFLDHPDHPHNKGVCE
jgi:hypothetical protein